VEIGSLTANLPRSQPNPNAYLKTIKPSSRIYSWVMNNHWHTNYRADQEGPVWFRFAFHPHHRYDSTEAMKFGVESTESLIAVPAAGSAPKAPPLRLEPPSVIATAFKPADDGRAFIVRLFGASAKTEEARLTWSIEPKAVFVSDASERPLQPVKNQVQVPGWDLVTLRAELP
jgi:alpha-mannosidase